MEFAMPHLNDQRFAPLVLLLFSGFPIYAQGWGTAQITPGTQCGPPETHQCALDGRVVTSQHLPPRPEWNDVRLASVAGRKEIISEDSMQSFKYVSRCYQI